MRPHLGLGDAFVMAGLVRAFHTFNPTFKILWPSKPHNFESCKELFADLPRVRVFKVENDVALDELVRDVPMDDRFRFGFYKAGNFDAKNWVTEFYRQAELDVSLSWSQFVLPQATIFRLFTKGQMVVSHDYAFVHDDPARGFHITHLAPTGHIYLPAKRSNNIFDHLAPLFHATEVHCIDSCFLHLADRVFHVTRHFHKIPKLYFHGYARKTPVPMVRCNWNIV